MSKFLILYRSTMSAAEQMANADPDAGAASMQAWMDWAAKAGEAIVDLGSPTQTVDGGEPGSYIGGYSMMQAASLDDLQSVLADHPHRAEGGTIEVLEVLELPGM
ncbi:YciI family protein [Tessaracoccus sp. Y1736]